MSDPRPTIEQPPLTSGLAIANASAPSGPTDPSRVSQGYCEGCNCGRANGEASALGAEEQALLARRQGRDPRSFTSPTVWPVQPAEGTEGVDEAEQGPEPKVPLRSKLWFNNPQDDMCGAYTERYLNDGRTLDEISNKRKPIIGIAQTGSDLTPCNSIHRQLAQRVREGIIAAGGTEFPCHPIQETSRRPSATIDRNLLYLSVVEVLMGYPIDGCVMLTGCDKTTPALLMAAATVNLPCIVLNCGPMLNGYAGTKLVGSGAVVWDSRALLAEGKITEAQFLQQVSLSAPSLGHCNTMGTASSMNAMAEALGMALPGSASIPAVYRERGACAYQTGRRAVELVMQDIKPSEIMTREAFENAIVACTAIGGSSNCPIHLNAIAKHMGVKLDCDDWDTIGYDLPLLVNIQPAGEYLCEEYHRAGGLPAVIAELLEHDLLPHPDALTVSGRTIGDNCKGDFPSDPRVIRSPTRPLKKSAGFVHLKGTLFDSAVMKTSVISPAFKQQHLENPDDPMAFEGPVVIFNGPEDYHERIDSVDADQSTILVMIGAGPVGYPGAAEVVNMRSPAHLLKKGIELPCLGDGRQSGTSGSPSILNASPEAASDSMLAYIKDGDIVRIDLLKRRADVKLSDAEIARRKKEMGPFKSRAVYPESQTPWQDLYRSEVGELSGGMVFDRAVKYQRIAQKYGVGRRNH